MDYKITGEFNCGLKVCSGKKIIMYSEVKRSFSNAIIHIYDNRSNLLLSVKQIFTNNFTIIDCIDNEVLNINQLNDKYIKFRDNKRIDFKSKWFAIGLYPKNKIIFEGKEIGVIKTKQLSLSINMELSIDENMNELERYIVILLLCKFSNQNHD